MIVNSLGYGHSVGTAGSLTPPGADSGSITDLTCTTCHSAHGPSTGQVSRYRNLLVRPPGSAANSGVDFGVTANAGNVLTWIGAGTGTFAAGGNYTSSSYYAGQTTGQYTVWPWIKQTAAGCTATGAGGDCNRYIDDEVNTPNQDMGAWCAQRHDNWHEDIATTNASGADWKRHPVDYALNTTETSGSGITTLDFTNYNNNGVKFRLPVMDGSATGFAVRDANTDKVFCLSCHFAHGGPYYDNLRWNYLQGVGAGNQTGNAIASNIGCQLCHNR